MSTSPGSEDPSAGATAAQLADLGPDESPYFNRELSWLQFNQRVLAEACNEAYPLLERLRFLSISGSNLDEFMMIRVAGLVGQVQRGWPRLRSTGAALRSSWPRSAPSWPNCRSASRRSGARCAKGWRRRTSTSPMNSGSAGGAQVAQELLPQRNPADHHPAGARSGAPVPLRPERRHGPAVHPDPRCDPRPADRDGADPQRRCRVSCGCRTVTGRRACSTSRSRA
jgi:hypothetical protein